MKLNIQRVVTTMVVATFLLKISFDLGATNLRSSDVVDMAYPQQVENNAQSRLSKALSENDGVGVVKSVLQISAARCALSNDTIVSAVVMIDSLIDEQPNDIRALLYLSQAMLYHKLYLEDRYKYDNRLSAYDESSDCRQWSRDQYAKKIIDLVKYATVDSAQMIGRSIDDYSEVLIELNREQEMFYPSLYDLVAYNSIYMLSTFANANDNVIPFGKTGKKQSVGELAKMLRLELVDTLVTLHKVRGEVAAEINAVIHRAEIVDQSRDLCDVMLEEYERYSDSEFSVEFLLEIGSVNDRNIDELLHKCDEYLTRFPTSYRLESVKNIVATLSAPSVDVSQMDMHYLSTEDISLDVAVRNLAEYVVRLYAVDSRFDRGSDYTLKKDDLRLIKEEIVSTDKDSLTASRRICKLNLGRLDYGAYALRVVTKDEKEKNFIASDYIQFVVTDMNAIYISDRQENCKLFAVSAKSGKPLENVAIKLNNSKLNTCADGSVSFRGNNKINYTLINGKDRLSGRFYAMSNYSAPTTIEYQIVTDLPIYHPGDTIKYAVVAFEVGKGEPKVLVNNEVDVELRGTDRNIIDKTTLTTDSTGRATGRFVLPIGGVRGRHFLSVANKYVSCNFRVEDYKTPTFFVNLDENNTEIEVGDKLVISGEVLTYSGMPLANAKVSIGVRYVGWWRSTSNANHIESTSTDDKGRFRIELDTEGIRGTTFAYGCYHIVASATSEAGETQNSNARRIYMGKAYRIDTDSIEQKICVDNDSVNLPISVLSITGSQVSTNIVYALIDEESKVVVEGAFMSPKFVLDARKIKSGEYKLKLSLPIDTSVNAEIKIQLYRNADKLPPIQTALWVPKSNVKVVDNNCEIDVLTSYKNANILCVISDSDKILESYWLNGRKNKYRVRVTSPNGYNHTRVAFYTVYYCQVYREEVVIIPKEEVTIEASSLRDKLNSGEIVTWNFKFKYNNQSMGNVPIMASMIDASLCSLENYRFAMPSFWNVMPSAKGGFANSLSYVNYSPEWLNCHLINKESVPMLNFYGQVKQKKQSKRCQISLFGYNGGLHSDNLAFASAEGVDVARYASTPKEHSDYNLNESDYKESTHPSAFFYPSLITDERGDVVLSFEVPNYDTTWKLKMLGYLPNAMSATYERDFISNRPIMVKSNLPRFLRVGDNANIKATIFNNTDSVSEINGGIQIFDVLSKKLIAEFRSESMSISPGDSEIIDVNFIVPDSVTSVECRTYAISLANNYCDGERGRVIVLPSSTPVVESIPFYLSGGENELNYCLENKTEDGKTTLVVCDNPIWECIMALPSIFTPKSETISELTTSLVANATANGIIKNYPKVKEALQELFAIQMTDSISVLQSSLQKEQNLKIVNLDNTLWRNDAQTESERMQRLSTIFQSEKNNVLILNLIEQISKLQDTNGGWRWHHRVEPSVYVTMEVLNDLSSLVEMNFVGQSHQLLSMINNGVGYVENELLKAYKEKKKFSTLVMLRYLYIKHRLKISKDSKPFKELKKEVLHAIIKEWKHFDIYNKAIAAIVLHRDGYNKESCDIVESLRQYAIRTEHRGSYYDNIGYNGYGRLTATATVLLAIHEISPSDSLVDELRQWLLIERQVQNWGNDFRTSYVVNAMLMTGEDWVSNQSESQIWINEQLHHPTHREELTGSYNLSLGNATGCKIKIVSNGATPWWGAIVSTYIAPITQVKSASIDDLSITKDLFVYSDDNLVPIANVQSLKVGQKVRMQMTITSKRDLEYVIVNDERSACVEPLSQSSSFEWQDGIGFYREVRDSAINFMITRLPKGTYVLYYDCYINRQGEYSLGIATVQSQYAPSMVAHSAGQLLVVE